MGGGVLWVNQGKRAGVGTACMQSQGWSGHCKNSTRGGQCAILLACIQQICMHCLYLEHVMYEVLAVKVDGAAPVGVVLAERALRVQASQGPERTTEAR